MQIQKINSQQSFGITLNIPNPSSTTPKELLRGARRAKLSLLKIKPDLQCEFNLPPFDSNMPFFKGNSSREIAEKISLHYQQLAKNHSLIEIMNPLFDTFLATKQRFVLK